MSSVPPAPDAPAAGSLADDLREAEDLFNTGRRTEPRDRLEHLLMICPPESSLRGDIMSPGFYDRYCYVEASHRHTRIEIGSNTLINNSVTLRAEGPGISIGADCLFGWNVQVLDSDFHDLHPARRRNGTPATAHVRIGNNTFLGANTIVTKGVSIGDDTVVGAGSLVVQSLPAGVIAAGTPAKVIRELHDMPLTAAGHPAARRAS